MSREDFEAQREYSMQKHKDRVAKTPNRLEFAKDMFKKNKIEYQLKKPETGHFHCWRKSDDKLFQFYAGTGKVQGTNIRGIHNLIKVLNG